MNRLKKYALLPLTLFIIFLGAAMPKLVSKAQDLQFREYRKEMELGSINLTLQKKSNVGPALHLISKAHTESPWEGETTLTEADARQAALNVINTLEQYGLLSKGDSKRFRMANGNAEPQLLVGEDGSAALIWFCTWADTLVPYITIDDATGKAVRILTDRTENSLSETASSYSKKWYAFLQDYYELELTVGYMESDGSENSLPSLFHLLLSSKDGSMQYDLNLEITNNFAFFNYCAD